MKFSTYLRQILVLAICLSFLGCGKKGGAGGNQKGPLSDAEAGSTNLTAVNEILREFVLKGKVIPKDINELVTSGFVPSLPTAPPGKKFAIQLLPMGYTVIVVDE